MSEFQTKKDSSPSEVVAGTKKWAVAHGEALETLQALPDNSVDSIVCDPPYGLEFMGKKWDRLVPTGGASFTADGMGKGFKALPSFKGSPNPSCRNCRGTMRGQDRKGFTRCRCDVPDFPDVRGNQARAMQEWHYAWAVEALRVLKPGGFMLAAGGSRTYHRLTCGIEDAGFEIRDCITWLYGSGFPKSLNVTKALRGLPACSCDVAHEVGTVVGDGRGGGTVEASRTPQNGGADLAPPDALVLPLAAAPGGIAGSDHATPVGDGHASAGAVDGSTTPVADAGSAALGTGEFHTPKCKACGGVRREAIPEGLGTALKPAAEFWVVARKPLIGTVAKNVLEHGTGALNIDATRVAFQGDEDKASAKPGGKATARSGALAGKTQAGRHFVIVGPNDLEDGPLYWSNQDGWGGRSAATVFDESEAGLSDPDETVRREWMDDNDGRNEFQAVQGKGRWPANVILDEEAGAALDEQTGERRSAGGYAKGSRGGPNDFNGPASINIDGLTSAQYDDSGGASRFFFVAPSDTMEGCEPAKPVEPTSSRDVAPPASAPSDAATSGSHEGKPSSATTGPSTSATPNESDSGGESATQATPSTADESSSEPPPSRRIPSPSPASDAATPEQTVTTTTTPSPLTSAGSAEAATSAGTPPRRGPGGSASLPIDRGADRFRYCAKTSKRERNEGMPEGLENRHPTVKPLSLMRYLVRLVTPPGGTVLDPFCGSGSTGCAAVSEGMSFIGVDNDEESVKTSRARIAYWANPFVRASKNKGDKNAR